MEHDDRAPVATFVVDGALAVGTAAMLGEAAAHHARVKRLETGDAVRLTNGAGTVARGSIAALRRGSVEVAVSHVEHVSRPSAIHLRVPVADRDRMLWLAEKATELGVASWQAVKFRRSASVTPRGEGPAFAEKVRARMAGALEQSGGAWLPELLPDVTADALTFAPGETPIVLAQGGEPLLSLITAAAAGVPVLLFGPEGGFEDDETRSLHERGWQRAALARTTLRFETAGIAAIAVVRAAHLVKEA